MKTSWLEINEIVDELHKLPQVTLKEVETRLKEAQNLEHNLLIMAILILIEERNSR